MIHNFVHLENVIHNIDHVIHNIDHVIYNSAL